jgi:hypothetical protein
VSYDLDAVETREAVVSSGPSIIPLPKANLRDQVSRALRSAIVSGEM